MLREWYSQTEVPQWPRSFSADRLYKSTDDLILIFSRFQFTPQRGSSGPNEHSSQKSKTPWEERTVLYLESWICSPVTTPKRPLTSGRRIALTASVKNRKRFSRLVSTRCDITVLPRVKDKELKHGCSSQTPRFLMLVPTAAADTPAVRLPRVDGRWRRMRRGFGSPRTRRFR